MKKVVVICGPTASGKTRISMEVAKYFKTDIINGDSVAVYKRLDIGSAKITKEEAEEVKHHLIDILDVGEIYSVADFQRECRKLMEVSDKPLIVGGTGLYIQACLYNYEFDAHARNVEFEEKCIGKTNDELYEELLLLVPNVAIHKNNRKRVLRALEMAKVSNKSITEINKKDELLYDAYIIYLDMERNILYERIHDRVDQMINQGLEQEVYQLYLEGKMIHAIGYKEFYPYFNKEITLDEVIEEIKKNTRHLAKRQMTWFKNQMNVHLYQVDLQNIQETINKIIVDLELFYKG